MVFYQITINVSKSKNFKEAEHNDGFHQRHVFEMKISDLFRPIIDNFDISLEKFIILPGTINGYELRVGCAFDPQDYTINDCIKALRQNLGQISVISKNEITSTGFKEIFKEADRRYTFPIYGLESKLNLDIDPDRYMFRDGKFCISERITTTVFSRKKECIEWSEKIMPSKSLLDEIKRIYSTSNEKKFYGHPVHYLITAKDYGAAEEIIDILLSALLGAKRLLSGRVTVLSDLEVDVATNSDFNKAFDLAQDGTVVVNLEIESKDGRFRKGVEVLSEKLQCMIDKYGDSTLFILVDISGKSSVTDSSIELFQSKTDIIHLMEGSGNYDEARRYLERLIQKSKYKGCDTSSVDQYIRGKRDV